MSTTIVVGGGLAGLTCALESAKFGSVVLIEKAKIGGNSAKATSGINCAIDKSDLKLFYDDVCRSGGDCIDKSLAYTLVQNSQEAIKWLEKQGITFGQPVKLGGHSHARSLRPIDSTGKVLPVGFTLVNTLKKLCQANPRIEILEGYNVRKLIRNDKGQVVGVICRPQNDIENGLEQIIKSDRVVITTGGYAYSNEQNQYLERYAPHLRLTPTTNGNTSIGEGLDLVKTIGGQLVDMTKIQLHPTGFIDPKDPYAITKFLCPEALRGVGGRLVNQLGLRFADELTTRDKLVNAIGEYCLDGQAYLIIDEKMAYEFSPSAIGFYQSKGLLQRVESIEELASKISEKHMILLNIYESCKGMNAPFYIGKVTPVVHFCMGGAKINSSAQVLDEYDQPISGLFACGEVSGGTHGQNRLAGCSLLECTVFGLLAARN